MGTRRPRTQQRPGTPTSSWSQIDGLGAEAGVIGNGQGKYHFWTVEYPYSYGTPPANSLAAAFLGYLNSYAAKDILRGQGYIPCTDRGLTSVQAFCQP